MAIDRRYILKVSNRSAFAPGGEVTGSRPLRALARRPTTLIVALQILAFQVQANAQAPEPAVERFREQWRWVQFDPESGIPPGRPIEVVESNGRTWLATDLGVAWFDGFEWRRISSRGGGSAPAPRRLTPDGRSGLYGIAVHSLVRVSRDSVWLVPLPGVPEEASVRWVAPLAEDDLLLLVDSMLVRHRNGSAEQVALPPGARATIERSGGRLLRTRPGNVWLIANGAWRWTGDGWESWFDGPVAIFRETEGGGLITTPNAPFRIHQWMAGERPAPVDLVTRPPAAMSVAPSGDAAIATFDGRVTLRINGTWLEVGTPLDQIEGIRQFVHRENGDLWAIGARGVFLHRGSSDRWDRWQIPGRDEVNGFVNEILRTRTGELWLGTGRGIVRRDSTGRYTEITAIGGRPLGGITALAEDTAGGVWIGSGAGLTGAYRWDGATWTRFGAADGLAAQRVHRIRNDRAGGVWFLGLDSTSRTGPGAFRWDGRRFTRTDELAGRRIYAFADAPDGTLWFGSDSGLFRRRQGRWTNWPATPDGVGARVHSLAVDSSGTAWFGHWTGGLGLGRIGADDRVERADIGDPGPRHEVTSIDIAPDGSVWFATHGGVGRIHQGTVSLLGREAGLTETRVWPLVTLSDRVLIGGDGLITLWLTESLDPPPRVRVDAPLAFGSEVLFRWTPLAWLGGSPSNSIETRYRIDSEPWSPWGLSRQIALYRLPPGSHRFQIEAKGLFGRIGSDAPPLSIDVPYPWYRRWQFLLPMSLVAAAFLTLSLLFARRRVEHRRALETLNRTLAADVEERRRTEAALEESRRVLQGIADSVPSILFLLRVRDTKVLFVNRAVERVLGYTREAMTAATSVGDFMTDTIRQMALAFLARVVAADEGAIVEGEAPMTTSDGRERTLAVRATVFARGADGRPESMLAVAHDVTEERRLESQLLQAQKMETVGRLAGGVAHDFNNILTAISGYAELAREGVDPRAQAAADIGEIARAADRARLLTMQLLTFARRQLIEPRIVDLNAVVSTVERMLLRLIGEDVELTTALSDQLWAVRVDPAQLEQVLVNLAVNARDAMPTGGRLTISTANAERWAGAGPTGERIDGPCVLLQIRDTGHGMSQEVALRAFEPFYTTKDPGKGTGLGLSTCYGIVRQAGGLIEIATAPGAGATFTIALPRVEEGIEAEAAQENGRDHSRGSELVLVVEDEGPVRRLTSRVLREAGYDVLEATNGRDALDVLAAAAGRVPSLLVSDVIMPEMGGPALWEILRARHPALRVLFTSGYTESAILHEGVADRSLPFLIKPFTGNTIAAKVREVLDT